MSGRIPIKARYRGSAMFWCAHCREARWNAPGQVIQALKWLPIGPTAPRSGTLLDLCRPSVESYDRRMEPYAWPTQAGGRYDRNGSWRRASRTDKDSVLPVQHPPGWYCAYCDRPLEDWPEAGAAMALDGPRAVLDLADRRRRDG